MRELTDRQAAVLRFVGQRIRDGVPPTLREIGNRFGIASTNGVNDHLTALERKGYIVRQDSLSRSILLTDMGDQFVGFAGPNNARSALLEALFLAAKEFIYADGDNEVERTMRKLDNAVAAIEALNRAETRVA